MVEPAKNKLEAVPTILGGGVGGTRMYVQDVLHVNIGPNSTLSLVGSGVYEQLELAYCD